MTQRRSANADSAYTQKTGRSQSASKNGRRSQEQSKNDTSNLTQNTWTDWITLIKSNNAEGTSSDIVNLGPFGCCSADLRAGTGPDSKSAPLSAVYIEKRSNPTMTLSHSFATLFGCIFCGAACCLRTAGSGGIPCSIPTFTRYPPCRFSS